MSPSGERLLKMLVDKAEKRHRVTLDQLWSAFDASCPELRGRPDRRDRLAGLVQELASAQALTCPKTKTLWERLPHPPLPKWVQLRKPKEETSPSLDRAAFPWASELGFLADSALTTSDGDLLALQAFFREGGRGRPSVPMRERSLSIFGDEKRLEKLYRTQLFRAGRLSLEALRCYAMSPPLVWEAGPGVGLPLLIVENHHTWESLRRFNHQQGRWSAVVYGAGKHVLSSIEFLIELGMKRRAKCCHYFGDLDLEGVRIPTRAAGRMKDAGGPSIIPAHDLYGLLLRQGCPQVAAKSQAGLGEAERTWLGASLWEDVDRLFKSEHRLAQEWVGWELLSEELGAG